MNKLNFETKNIRYGGYAALISVITISIILVINIIFSGLDIKQDLTKEKFYSLSDESKNILKEVKEPISIYVLEETGKEDKNFKEILQKYTKASSKIAVIYKDPVLYPQFAKKYIANSSSADESISNGSIIVENASTNKFKLITQNELYNMTYDQYSGPQVTSLAIEQKVTSAIDYVTSQIDSAVFVTSGHTEAAIPANLKAALESKNFSINDINLRTDKIPQSSNNILLIFSPHTDFMDTERDKILDFLDKGGRAMIFTDYDTPELPNFEKILAYYGTAYQPGVTVEGDAKNMLTSYPTFILPLISSHEITNSLVKNKVPVLIPVASSLKTLDTKRKEVTIEPILRTSENSWLKVNTQAKTLEKESGDIKGPIDISYAIEDKNTLDSANPITTRLFVISNSVFMNSDKIDLSGTGNVDLVKNALLWLQNKDTSLSISAKAFTDYTLPAMTTAHLILFGGVSIIIIPLIIVILGIAAWLRRKNL